MDEELRILDPSAYDYESFTGAEAACIQPFTDSNDTPMRVSVEELQERMDRGDELFIDVRPKEQFDMCALNGFMNVPLSELPSRIAEVKEYLHTKRQKKRGRRLKIGFLVHSFPSFRLTMWILRPAVCVCTYSV